MPVYLSLGSNVGERVANLRSALTQLREAPGIEVVQISRIYETAPVGDTEQPAFLNMVAAIETTLEPLELLDRLQEIERQVGRVPTRRWGPRVIDIDIVLWDDRVMNDPQLTIPHAEMRNRAFVLVPLAEIAPGAVDPVSGRTAAELALEVTDPGGVRVTTIAL